MFTVYCLSWRNSRGELLTTDDLSNPLALLCSISLMPGGVNVDKAHPEYWRLRVLAQNMSFMDMDTIVGCLENLTESERRPLYEIFGILIFREDMLPPIDNELMAALQKLYRRGRRSEAGFGCPASGGRPCHPPYCSDCPLPYSYP